MRKLGELVPELKASDYMSPWHRFKDLKLGILLALVCGRRLLRNPTRFAFGPPDIVMDLVQELRPAL